MRLPKLALADPAMPLRKTGVASPSGHRARSADPGASITPRIKGVGPTLGASYGGASMPVPPLSSRSQAGPSRRHHMRESDGMSPCNVSASKGMLSSSARDAERLVSSERQLDSYVTAVSKETLLSEQYAKELVHARERIKQLAGQLGPRAGNSNAANDSLSRSRARAMKRTAGMEGRLSEIEKYNERLAEAINALRKQSQPHFQRMKKATAQTVKRHADMQQLKQAAIKALDERDRFKAQLRMMRDEAAQERHHFAGAVSNVEKQLEVLEDEHGRTAEELAAATETAKKKQFLEMKKKRAHKEKLDVRYGYLRSQLEAIDGEFRRLERIVGVHFLPNNPGSLEHIISKFSETETHIASLQQFWERQNQDTVRESTPCCSTARLAPLSTARPRRALIHTRTHSLLSPSYGRSLALSLPLSLSL